MTATVTESSISLRYNMRGFTPALIPASTEHSEAHEVQIFQHLLCAAQAIRLRSYQSQTEHDFFTDAINFRQFLSNGAHQTDQSVSGENGLLSMQMNLLPQTVVFKTTHTHRSREYYSDLTWEHIFQHSCCH